MAVINGGAGNDTLTGTSGEDYLYGNGGNDSLLGGANRDRLYGGAGADTLDGGADFDWAIYQASTVGLVIDLNDGSRSTGDALGDVYVGIESYVGSQYNDTFIAGLTQTIFDGGGGADDVVDYSVATAGITINAAYYPAGGVITAMTSGGNGYATGDQLYNIDRVIGTYYDDVYTIDSTASGFVVTELANGGYDKVYTNLASYTLTANVEELVYTGTAAFTGYGNSGNNLIKGGSGQDRLFGGAGADTLDGGGAEFDWISYQGSAALVIDLNDGSQSTGDAIGDVYYNIDSYIGSTGNDRFVAGLTKTVFDGGNGADDVVDYRMATAGFTLNAFYHSPGAVVVANMAGADGYATGDQLYNIDRVIGTYYDDVYTIDTSAVNFNITEMANGGFDEVITNHAGLYYLSANIEKLTYTGSGTFSGFGTGIANMLVGGSGADWLFGGGGADTLVGGNGYDWAVYDGGGAVTVDLYDGSQSTGDAAGDVYSSIEGVWGSTGNDRFIAGLTAVRVDGSAGTDTLDYSAATAGIVATISGPNANNISGTVSGGNGWGDGDSFIKIEGIVGTSHNDVYILDDIVSRSSFAITETANGGIDEIRTSISMVYYLPTHFENVTYVGTGSFNGVGNSAANVMTGGAGNDLLAGGGGADTLIGGDGYDWANYDGNSEVVVDLFDGSQSTGAAVGDVYIGIESYIGSTGNDTFIAGMTATTFDGGNGGLADVADYSGATAGLTLTVFTTDNIVRGSLSGGGGMADGDYLYKIDRFIATNHNDLYIMNYAGDGFTIIEAANGGFDEVSTNLYILYLPANIEKLTYTGTGTFTGVGNNSNNIITGGAGNDLLLGGGGADTLNGGDGFDSASYDGAPEVVVDLFDGTRSTGAAVGDVFNSIEAIIGSLNNDTFYAGVGATVFNGGGGGLNDVINYSLASAGITVTLTATSKFNPVNGAVSGGNGVGDGDTFYNIERIVGTDHGDVYVLDQYVAQSSFQIVESATGGIDEIRVDAAIPYTLIANVENLTYTGGTVVFTGTGNALNNVIKGGGGADTLSGLDGNDTLIGGAGADVLQGGNGTDMASYVTSASAISLNLKTNVKTGDANGDSYNSIEIYGGSNHGDIFVSGTTAHRFDGADGNDTIDYSTSAAAVTVDLTAGTGLGGDAQGDSFVSIETAIGSAFADTLASSTAGNVLQGGTGDDVYLVGDAGVVVTETASAGTDEVRTALASLSIATFANVEKLSYTGNGNFTGTGNDGANLITGGVGNDVLIGGAGADTLDGGDGFDAADYLASATAVSVDLTAGTGLGGDAEGDSLLSIETAIGSTFADTLASATAGHVLQGGAGDDIYLVGDAGVVVTEAASAGMDEVRTALASLSIASFANVEALSYTGSGNFTGTGNAEANRLTGGIGNDILAGGAGADTLDGADGLDAADYSASASAVTVDLTAATASGGDAQGDTLVSIEKVIGSALADTLASGTAGHVLQGGAGNDVYLVGDAGVVVTEAASAGTDEVRTTLAALSIASFANVENLTFTGAGAFTGTGNSLANRIVSGSGDDSLYGGSGNDTLVGSAGADLLDGGSNTDTVDYATSNAAVTVDLTAATASGGDAQGDTLISIERVTGSAYADTLASATSGHLLQGGAGNDVYIVGNAGVTVSEGSNAGLDEVRTTVASLTLATNVETLTYVGTGAFAGTGNSSANLITGATGNDTLNGAGGNDTLTGGDGDDLLIGGTGADLIQGGNGTDIASYETASAAISINLKSGAKTGDANGDVYADIEIYRGSAHGDTFISGTDAHSFDGAGGTDTVDYATSTAGVSVDLTAGTGSGGDAQGDSFSAIERVIGSGFADTLSSATAGHVLQGGAGDDLYVVNDSGVVVTENGSEGTDTIQTSLASFSLAALVNVEGLSFAGTGDFSGTGNAGANLVVGGAGNDTLDGGGGADTLQGGDGADHLFGGSGSLLFGGNGSDMLHFTTGGTGDGGEDGDTYDVTGASGVVHVQDSGTTGIDTLVLDVATSTDVVARQIGDDLWLTSASDMVDGVQDQGVVLAGWYAGFNTIDTIVCQDSSFYLP